MPGACGARRCAVQAALSSTGCWSSGARTASSMSSRSTPAHPGAVLRADVPGRPAPRHTGPSARPRPRRGSRASGSRQRAAKLRVVPAASDEPTTTRPAGMTTASGSSASCTARGKEHATCHTRHNGRCRHPQCGREELNHGTHRPSYRPEQAREGPVRPAASIGTDHSVPPLSPGFAPLGDPCHGPRD
jgi:hypothetical protein